jgi:DNA-binding FadR family transcriptional regulator
MQHVVRSLKPVSTVQDYLLEAMVSGTYGPGAKLPTERALAEKLNVPRSIVRDALSVLESQKRVVRIIGSGTYVSSEPPAGETMRAEAGKVSPSEIMATRMIFEPRLVMLVVANADAADFERMEECNRRAEASDDFIEFERWDAALHQAIAEATHNRLVVSIYGTITASRDLAEWGELKRRSITSERRDVYRTEHREIVAALRARDARRAEAAIAAHLSRVRDNLFGV